MTKITPDNMTPFELDVFASAYGAAFASGCGRYVTEEHDNEVGEAAAMVASRAVDSIRVVTVRIASAVEAANRLTHDS